MYINNFLENRINCKLLTSVNKWDNSVISKMGIIINKPGAINLLLLNILVTANKTTNNIKNSIPNCNSVSCKPTSISMPLVNDKIKIKAIKLYAIIKVKPFIF